MTSQTDVFLIADGVAFHSYKIKYQFVAEVNLRLIKSGVQHCDSLAFEYTFNNFKQRYPDLYEKKLKAGYSQQTQFPDGITKEKNNELIILTTRSTQEGWERRLSIGTNKFGQYESDCG